MALVHIVRTMKCLNILARVTPCILGGHLGYRMESQVNRKLNECPSLVLLVHAMNVVQSMPPRFRNVTKYSIWVLYSMQRLQNRRLQRGLVSLILRLGVAGVSDLKLNYSTLRANCAYCVEHGIEVSGAYIRAA